LAQDLRFKASAVLPLAERLTNAFRVAVGDVNRDGRPDIAVGSAAGVVLLLAGADSQFEPGRVIPVSSPCPTPDIALADLDRDGALDLAVYCPPAGKVFTYRGQGDGSFRPPESLATSISASARGMVAADLNGDGILDLALGQDGKVTVLFGNGDATFRMGTELKIAGSPTGGVPVALAVADFNRDGIPDVATANPVDYDDLSIFLGAGGGLFTAERKVPTEDRPHDLVPADYDHDGNMDLAVACDGGLLLFTGDGHGSFRAGPEVLSGDRAVSVATADLNGDGLPDFVVGNYYGGRITVILNGGDGTFRPAATVASIGDVFSVVLADMNGDSRPDLIASSYSGSSALLALGRGNGVFESPTYFGTDYANSFPIRLADIDADGKTELAVILQGRRTISILHPSSGRASTIRRDDYVLDGVFADFDRDGIPDLALVTVPSWQGVPGTDFNATLRVLPGRGDGSFAADIVTPIERCPAYQGYGSAPTSRFLSVASGDFDGDGIADIALVNLPVQELQIYHGSGDGTFRLTQRFPTAWGGALISADFDGDGVQDLALFEGQAAIYSGNAKGGMIKSASPERCQGSGSLERGDFNGDGKPDVLLNCGSDLTVLFNAGGGLFRAAPRFVLSPPRGRLATLSAIGDFDRDGRDDLAAITYDLSPADESRDESIVILFGILFSDGNGSFGGPAPAPVAVDAASMIAMDFDGDGRTDLVVVDASDGTLKALRNKAGLVRRRQRESNASRDFASLPFGSREPDRSQR